MMRKTRESPSALARFWQRSRVSLIIAAVLVMGVIFFGLHDVGIVLGILMATVLMFELTRRWRRIRNFIILFISSFLGIVFLAFLDVEVVKYFVPLLGGAGAVNGKGFQVFNQIVSLIILFFGTAGLITGFLGTVILGLWRLAGLRKRRKTEANT
jgi:hypothetical protein